LWTRRNQISLPPNNNVDEEGNPHVMWGGVSVTTAFLVLGWWLEDSASKYRRQLGIY